MLVTYVKGTRRIPNLFVKNHKYVKHRSSEKATYWKCHLYDGGLCKSRCITKCNQTIKFSSERHGHGPTPTPTANILGKEYFFTTVKVKKSF